jgi:anti-sigma factor RsiW
MKKHNIERLNALADGELRGLSRWMAERHLRRCRSCAKEYQQVQRVREALAVGRPTVEMSESVEFFWSKVQREIQSRTSQTETVPMPQLTVGDWFRVHQPVWASTAAAVAVIAGMLIVFNPLSGSNNYGAVTVQDAETGIPNTEARTLKSTHPDVAVIWVSGLEWAPNMEEMKRMLENPEDPGET